MTKLKNSISLKIYQVLIESACWLDVSLFKFDGEHSVTHNTLTVKKKSLLHKKNICLNQKGEFFCKIAAAAAAATTTTTTRWTKSQTQLLLFDSLPLLFLFSFFPPSPIHPGRPFSLFLASTHRSNTRQASGWMYAPDKCQQEMNQLKRKLHVHIFFALIDAQNGLKSENVFRKKHTNILEFLLVFTCLKSTYTRFTTWNNIF